MIYVFLSKTIIDEFYFDYCFGKNIHIFAGRNSFVVFPAELSSPSALSEKRTIVRSYE